MAAGMTKTQLVRKIAVKHGINSKQASALLDHLGELAVKEAKRNSVFVLPAMRSKSSRKGEQTGEVIRIPARELVKFRVGGSRSTTRINGTVANKAGAETSQLRIDVSGSGPEIVVAGPSFSDALKSLAKVY
jgi:DNA-binding protein HU-beta